MRITWSAGRRLFWGPKGEKIKKGRDWKTNTGTSCKRGGKVRGKQVGISLLKYVTVDSKEHRKKKPRRSRKEKLILKQRDQSILREDRGFSGVHHVFMGGSRSLDKARKGKNG